jgi:hypothetical protein
MKSFMFREKEIFAGKGRATAEGFKKLLAHRQIAHMAKYKRRYFRTLIAYSNQ